MKGSVGGKSPKTDKGRICRCAQPIEIGFQRRSRKLAKQQRHARETIDMAQNLSGSVSLYPLRGEWDKPGQYWRRLRIHLAVTPDESKEHLAPQCLQGW